MKREKRLTKRERKALAPARSQASVREGQHIHCIACGRHLEPSEFDPPAATATRIACKHRSTFPTCMECITTSRALLAEHDRTGQAVQTASAWH